MSLIFILLIIGSSYSVDVENLSLKQVFILSRHGVRETIATDAGRYTPNKWPSLTTEPEHLTPWGVLIEGLFGEYFHKWFERNGLFKGCPKEDEVFVYANSKNRTVETAKSFVKSAFKDCDIPVRHRDVGTFDPVFNSVIHNIEETHKSNVINEMQRKLDEANLKSAFTDLNEILDIEKSDICKTESICDLAEAKNEFVYQMGEEPRVRGPLNISNSVLDRFLVGYYRGLPLEEIAWGKIKTIDHWRALTEINRQHKNVLFNTTAADDIAGPLLSFMSELFRFSYSKLNLLVGHDYNAVPVLRAMGFLPTELPYQFDPIPIGGKLVFQKWGNTTEDYLKVEFIYQSHEQFRNPMVLDLDNKPEIILMELKSCKIDQNGLCPWSEFINNLKF